MSDQATVTRLAGLLNDVLVASDREVAEGIDEETFLLEVLDSIILASLIARIEKEWDVVIDDDEIAAEIFEDLRSLASFVDLKVASEIQNVEVKDLA